MDKLLWPSIPLLTSVHLQEEVARRARDALSACILASLTPLRRCVCVCIVGVYRSGDVGGWLACAVQAPSHSPASLQATKVLPGLSASRTSTMYADLPLHAATWPSTRFTSHCLH